MSGFIERDYLSPLVSEQLSNVALKTQWHDLVGGYTTVNGTDVLKPFIVSYAAGRGFTKTPLYNRFLRSAGISKALLKKQNYSDIAWTAFALDSAKSAFSVKTKASIAGQFNDDYYFHTQGRTIKLRVSVGGSRKVGIKTVDSDELVKITADTKELIQQEVFAHALEYFRISEERIISNVAVQGSYTTYADTLSSRIKLLEPVISITYEKNTGSYYDILALLDTTSSVFEYIGITDEKMTIVKSGPFTAPVYSSKKIWEVKEASYFLYDTEYSYTIEYKVRSGLTINESSPITLLLYNESILLKQAITNKARLSNNRLKGGAPTSIATLFKVAPLLSDTYLNNILYAVNDNDLDIEATTLWGPVVRLGKITTHYLRRETFENMSHSQFRTFFNTFLTTAYDIQEKDSSFLESFVTAVFSMVMIGVAAFGAITGQLWISAAALGALTLSQKMLADAGHYDLAQQLAGAVQVVTIINVAAIIQTGYLALESDIATSNAVTGIEASDWAMAGWTEADVAALQLDLQLNIAVSAAQLGMAGYNMLTTLGILESTTSELATWGSILWGTYQSGKGLFDSLHPSMTSSGLGLKDLTFKNASNFLKLAENGASAYLNIKNNDATVRLDVTEEQAVSEEQASAAYVMGIKRLTSYDALEETARLVHLSYGSNNTDAIKSRNYGVGPLNTGIL